MHEPKASTLRNRDGLGYVASSVAALISWTNWIGYRSSKGT